MTRVIDDDSTRKNASTEVFKKTIDYFNDKIDKFFSQRK